MSELEIITLSSSDEEEINEPPRKRIKPLTLETADFIPLNKNEIKNGSSDDIVILSDEDCGSPVLGYMLKYDKISKESKNVQKNKHSEHSITIKDDEIDSVTIISDSVTIISEIDEILSTKTNETNGDINEIINEKDNSIIIYENNSADSSGKENKSDNLTVSNLCNTDKASTSTDTTNSSLIEKFLVVCEKSIDNSDFKHLIKTRFIELRQLYKVCSLKLCDSINFMKLVDENIARAQKTPAAAVISFNEIYQYVKALVAAESVEVSEEDSRKLKMLEKTMKRLVKRIKLLEDSEVNFDDEEDSSYLQLDRYTARLNKLHKKYCKLLKKNPYSGRITHEKLDFVDSEYNEINTAINKRFKNNKEFPSYLEMEQFIKKIVDKENLKLSEVKIKNESVRCFKKLGELLQNRRKKELFQAHYLYITDSEDPAKNDTTLDTILKQNFSEGQVKIENICEEYATKHELGEEAVVSEEESDNSGSESSENENNHE